jgi:hypothetical protein
MRQVMWVVLWGLVAAPVWGQEGGQFRFFACGTVRFFGEPCGPDAGTLPPVAAPIVPTPAAGVSASPPAPASTPVAPSEALFTPETVAPTTPPLLLRVLQEPTEAHAQAFLDWQRARLARIVEVQALLQRLGQVQGPAGGVRGDVADRAGLPATASPCPLTPGSGGRRVCALQGP